MAYQTCLHRLALVLTAFTCAVLMSSRLSFAENAPIAPIASPDVYRIVAENDQFRVLRATWQPGQVDNFHSHPADRVSLYETDCKLRLTRPDGTYRDGRPVEGKARARTGQPVQAHRVKNMGSNVCVVWIVELKEQ